MPLRWGPGPVFIHESIAATRRWQLYGLRAFFVLCLLMALGLVWLLACLEEGKPVGSISIKQLAQSGEYFFYAIATTQLMVVLLVAPAATAGAICLDRARGNLTHMLVTDLADSEIVLGKLAARFLPVVALVAATIPVLAMAGLLGGVIFEAILSLTAITLALAVFGCALALAISVRATKTHEVLMAVYGIESLWILGPLVWEILSSTRVVPAIPTWVAATNPFVLAWAPYSWPASMSAEWLAGFLGALILISAGLMAYAVFRLRAATTRGPGSATASRLASWWGRVHARFLWWRPSPSLDNDPVLWREWRRGRPSRLARVVWGLFIAFSLAGFAAGTATIVDDDESGSQFLMLVNGLHATFGLLLVSLFAPTVLAEERVRGSLDVLMTTPLPTDRIVLAKWWAAYRVVPALAVLPAVSCMIIVTSELQQVRPPGPLHAAGAPLDAMDCFAYVALPVAMLLGQGAAVVSVGLALATWIRRVGRAVAVSVTWCSFFAFGWLILIEISDPIVELLGFGAAGDQTSREFIIQILGAPNPLCAQVLTFETASWPVSQGRIACYIGQLIMLLAIIGFALVVLALTMVTFNRCVGRMPERPRRAPRPPRRSGTPAKPHSRKPGATQTIHLSNTTAATA
jgi:ABC-type transport system involved in multi-copper enzyme maturation permease subunit